MRGGVVTLRFDPKTVKTVLCGLSRHARRKAPSLPSSIRSRTPSDGSDGSFSPGASCEEIMLLASQQDSTR